MYCKNVCLNLEHEHDWYNIFIVYMQSLLMISKKGFSYTFCKMSYLALLASEYLNSKEVSTMYFLICWDSLI